MNDSLKIGVLATQHGPFTALGTDGLRGVQLAVNEFKGQVAGKKIELLIEGTDATPSSAYDKVEYLVNEKDVLLTIGPLSGNEGLAVRNFAKTRPDKIFVNGAAGAQDITLRDPAPNFYNFSPDGVQCIAGLGRYAYEKLGYWKVVTLGEDYSFPHSQIGGFMTEFCRAGGRVIQKIWVSLANVDFHEAIHAIPADAEAVFVALGGTDAINFLKQYDELGKERKPLLIGSITADQTILSEPDLPTDYLRGAIGSGPTADDFAHATWKAFVENYRKAYPDALNFPSFFSTFYYLNTKAVLLALQASGGDFSTIRLKAELDTLQFEGPCGPVRLDHHRQAIANVFVTEVARNRRGVAYRKLVQVIESVNQTLGLPEEDYLAMGSFSRDNPSCP